MGKKQHYVPASHIALFSDDTSFSPRLRKIGFAFIEKDGMGLKHIASKAENVGAVNNLYQEYGTDTEGLFAVIEGKVGDVLKKIVAETAKPHATRVRLSPLEYRYLSNYILTLSLRQPKTLEAGVSEVYDLLLHKSDGTKENLADILRGLSSGELIVNVPIPSILVLREPTPLCLSSPFHVMNRQTAFPISPTVAVLAHVEFETKPSQDVFVEILRERQNTYSLADFWFAQSFLASDHNFQFVYPLSQKDNFIDKYFDNLDKVITSFPLEHRMTFKVDKKTRYFYVRFVPNDSAEGQAREQIVNNLNQKDNLVIAQKRKELFDTDINSNQTGLNQNSFYAAKFRQQEK